MAILQCPVNVTSITTTTSGAQTPSANKVTITAAEMTDIITNTGLNMMSQQSHPDILTSNIATGALTLSMAKSITSLTLNGNTYAVTAGVSASMTSVDGTQLCYEGFTEVIG